MRQAFELFEILFAFTLSYLLNRSKSVGKNSIMDIRHVLITQETELQEIIDTEKVCFELLSQ